MNSQPPIHPRSSQSLSDGYISFGHPTAPFKLPSGQTVPIDRGILDLIRLMNTIPGIETRGSCQGEAPNYGYVQFMPAGDEARSHASVYFMYHILRNMHGAWVRHRHAMWEHEQSTGAEHPDAYRFKFTTELGNGYVLKWSPYTYPAVLATARQAAEDTTRDT